ncbi:MAG: hypothetical protein ACFCU5_13315 [Pleurocapsa sp.]
MNHNCDENLSNSDDVLGEVQFPTVDGDTSLQTAVREIWRLAKEHHHDILFLLDLLRSLEAIHRKIRTEMFEASLPATRNDLYQLVKDIEEKGGWPYVERMKLRELLKNMELNPSDEPPGTTNSEA